MPADDGDYGTLVQRGAGMGILGGWFMWAWLETEDGREYIASMVYSNTKRGAERKAQAAIREHKRNLR